MLHPLARSATDSELEFIAGLDYGQDASIHLEELRSLIRVRDGVFKVASHWYPREVIELGSHCLQPGHEREFAICTLLVLHAVRTGADGVTEVHDKFVDRAADYDLLPPDLKCAIHEAYRSLGVK